MLNFSNIPHILKNKTTSLLLHISLMFLIGSNSLICYSQPNPVNIESTNLYKHGTNASNLVGPVAGEATDSVTVGSTTKYFIFPDTTVNPLYDYNIDPFNNVVSTFAWTVTPAISTAGAVPVPAYNTAPHYRQIVWTSAGNGNIQVAETSNAGCTGSTIITPVTVIAVPTVQFAVISGSDCKTETDGSLNYNLNSLPISWTSEVNGLRNLKVNLTVSCNNPSFTPQAVNNIAITETGIGSGTFDIPFTLNYYGLYTITLTTINDRISSKVGINGTTGAANTYTFLLSKIPASNPVYHITNN